MTPPSGQPASARDRHLFGPGPKRMLALDGGGVRGAMTIAFLERLERVVAEIEGKPVRLGDWFDVIGGTSTGAIIATGLALGYSAAEMHAFYRELGPRVFKPSRWRLVGVQSKFDSTHLVAELKRIVGARTLGTDDLRTGLCIFTKRMDTGSPWIVMNNPRSPFWDTPADNSFTGNRHYPLVNLVRASAAAPHFFEPESIEIAPGMPPGLFVDGGVSPHNNPSLYLLLIAALPQYRLQWPLGPDNLTIVSVGTGSFRYRLEREALPWAKSIAVAVHALRSQMADAQQFAIAMMSWLGESPTSWPINSELGDLGTTPPPGGRPLFRYMRYDVRLEPDWIARELGRSYEPAAVTKLRRLDAAENIHTLYELGAAAAERQIRPEHFARGPAAQAVGA
jgi:hypothetical protein